MQALKLGLEVRYQHRAAPVDASILQFQYNVRNTGCHVFAFIPRDHIESARLRLTREND